MSDFNEQNVGARWYVAHTYSGYENKVKMNLEKIIENRGLQHLIYDIRIPTETIIESDGGTEREVEQKIFPSYVLIKMTMTDENWHVVRNITGVTGFVGPGSKPTPLTDEEADAIISEQKTTQVTLQVGDMVDIVDGVFADFSGRLDEISPDGNEVTVVVSSLGRDMPIKLDMKQIRKKAEQ